MLSSSNIYLIGPMGAGKTTIGRRLAERRGLQFIDSDHEIEARTGVDIPYIFEKEGEPGFRKREQQTIAELVQLQGVVLATGGGAILDSLNRQALADHGFVVYLHASVDHQYQRTARAANRPLLHAAADRREVLARLFAIRDPLYQEIADLVLRTDNRSAKTLIREIERVWIDQRPAFDTMRDAFCVLPIMNTLHVDLGSRSYPIHIGSGLLAQPQWLADIRQRPLRLITDVNVAAHYLAPLRSTLGLRDEQQLILSAGEGSKTMAQVEQVMDWLLATRLPRDGVLVALGGGVIGDLAGFCAAIYQRGIDFVQVPTTLLAQVDSSVGGKTGVNHPRGKNMIGAFHQPQLVLADTDTLKTLPQRELLAGLAEVIKYGMLGDVAFLAWIEKNLDALLALDAAALSHAIQHSCAMKAAIVAQDERESLAGGAGPRALLNLGHTFAHAIETHTGYTQWLHGEAVAVGLCMAADLSARLGWISSADAQRCEQLIARSGLPIRPPPDMNEAHFRALMSLDKKVASGQLRLVLMKPLGGACVSADFEPAALAATLKHFTQR